MQNLFVLHKAYANVWGSDLIRQPNGEFAVLEDNLRVPSGVSYMLANREASKRVFPGTFRGAGVRSIDRYPDLLLTILKTMAACQSDPGIGGPDPRGAARSHVGQPLFGVDGHARTGALRKGRCGQPQSAAANHGDILLSAR